MYKKLGSSDQKMKFLRQFWKKLDPTPGTPLNERLRDHIVRMRHTEENFMGRPGKRGSDTDKGRVYILYGPPDDLEYDPAAAGGKSVETWTYNRSGRFVFVFYDRHGHGILELVHSTMSGEIFDPTWESRRF